MLDARNVHRKVTRKIYDFSPEQMQNLAAIIWLYRGQRERFLVLIKQYLNDLLTEGAAVEEALTPFNSTLADLVMRFETLSEAATKADDKEEGTTALFETVKELHTAQTLYQKDVAKLTLEVNNFEKKHRHEIPELNNAQHAMRESFEPIAEAINELMKQANLLYKLAAHIASQGSDLSENEAYAESYDKRETGKIIKRFHEEREAVVDQLRRTVYFHKQVAWLQERFPKAELADVPGLVKLVDRKDIEAADWGLSPGRYVGVAPPEDDEDFDFEETIREIHLELSELNKEAAGLAEKIQSNFLELGI